jgi:hypothetical protein
MIRLFGFLALTCSLMAASAPAASAKTTLNMGLALGLMLK